MSIRAIMLCTSPLVFSLVLAGCGGETETAQGPAPSAIARMDACAIVSAGELQSAVGIAAEGKNSRSGGANACTWMGGGGQMAVLQVFPSADGFAEARQAYESLYRAQAEELPGLGDRAFFIAGSTGAFPTASVTTIKGATPVSIQIMGGEDDAERRAEALALAEVVVAKM